jgi:hypothetical protein
MIKHATELIGKVPEVYSLARLPPDLGFEEVFENMKVLLDEGLFGAFGASEMKRESLERAHKVSHGPKSIVCDPLLLWRATISGSVLEAPLTSNLYIPFITPHDSPYSSGFSSPLVVLPIPSHLSQPPIIHFLSISSRYQLASRSSLADL